MAINYDTIKSNTLKKYKFVLETSNGTFELDNAPLGWDDSSIELNRDIGLGGLFSEGIFTQYEVGSLVFIKDGFHILYGKYENGEWTKGLYLQYGIFSSANIIIYYLDRISLEYVQFPTKFELDFNTLKTERKNLAISGVQIKAIATGFVSKLLKRMKTPVDLTRTTSLGGYNIVDYTDLKTQIQFNEIFIYLTSTYYLPSLNGVVIDAGDLQTLSFPSTIVSADFTESQTVLLNTIGSASSSVALFKDATQSRIILLELDYEIELVTGGDLEIWYAILDTDGTTVFYSELIESYGSAGVRTKSFSKERIIAEDRSIVLYAIAGAKPKSTFPVNFNSVSVTISEPETQSPATIRNGFPIYEATERCLQHCLDTQYPFKSDYLGRTDVIKNADGDYYSSEDQERFYSISNGLSLRGLTFDDIDNSVAVTFENIIKTLIATDNVGVGYEIICGADKIVIEDFDYIFKETTTLNISDRLNENEIEVEVMIDYAYAEVQSGYKSFDYEEVNGRGEYNTKNVRTTEIPNGSKLSLISDFRADTKGISIQIANPVTGEGADGTKDYKGDNDIFIIKTQRNGDDWKVETDENIQIVDGTSLFQDESLNLWITPTRCLLRNKVKLATGLDKISASSLRFQTSDKLASLKTTDGTVEITENQDIKVTASAPEPEIGSPKFDPEKLTVTIPFYEEDFNTVKNDPNGLIILSNNYSGWITNLKYTLGKSEATIELIKKH